jgi:hypothetical protein
LALQPLARCTLITEADDADAFDAFLALSTLWAEQTANKELYKVAFATDRLMWLMNDTLITILWFCPVFKRADVMKRCKRACDGSGSDEESDELYCVEAIAHNTLRRTYNAMKMTGTFAEQQVGMTLRPKKTRLSVIDQELASFLAAPPIRASFPPEAIIDRRSYEKAWRRYAGKRFPAMCEAILALVALCPSEAVVERAFSWLRRAVKDESRMKPDIAQARLQLICFDHWEDDQLRKAGEMEAVPRSRAHEVLDEKFVKRTGRRMDKAAAAADKAEAREDMIDALRLHAGEWTLPAVAAADRKHAVPISLFANLLVVTESMLQRKGGAHIRFAEAAPLPQPQDEDRNDGTCAACGFDITADRHAGADKPFAWIKCRTCKRSAHYKCLELSRKTLERLATDVANPWDCRTCRDRVAAEL